MRVCVCVRARVFVCDLPYMCVCARARACVCLPPPLRQRYDRQMWLKVVVLTKFMVARAVDSFGRHAKSRKFFKEYGDLLYSGYDGGSRKDENMGCSLEPTRPMYGMLFGLFWC